MPDQQEEVQSKSSEEIIAKVTSCFEEQQRIQRQAERKARKEQERKENIRFRVIGLLFLAGILVLGFQVFVWLRSGEWLSIPLGIVMIGLDQNGALALWLSSPGSWYGLHEALMWILNLPLSLVLIGSSLIMLWLSGL